MSALYPLRDRIRYKLPYWVTQTYDNIRFWFNPRQKWLIKQIPNHWIDKDTLWELCILEGIKHYVEQDGGLDYYEDSQSDPEYPDHQKKFDREVMENYRLITQELPLLEWKLKQAWEKVPKVDWKNLNNRDNRSYEEIYGDTDKYEKEITDLKTKVMIWAVQNRESIWT